MVVLVAGTLVVSEIPYVDRRTRVARGKLVVPVEMAGNVTVAPSRHDVYWAGDPPCDAHGHPLSGMTATRSNLQFANLPVDYHLCHRISGREFHDYHELVTSYVKAFEKHAVLLQADATARVGGGVIADHNPASPFHYVDTASSLAGIETFSRTMEGLRIGIVGLGGTGAYVLDLVAKTPVAAIHLFDDDTFDQHNAFRAPGAAAIEELAARRMKVDHFTAIYSRQHRGVFPHASRLKTGTLHHLDGLDFVFVCIDDAPSRGAIVDRIERNGVPFIDVGIGIVAAPKGLLGLVRVTTSTSGTRERARSVMPDATSGEVDAYRSNVQVADLNALAAAFAVMRWKRMCGFYRDEADEHQSVYDIGANRLHIA